MGCGSAELLFRRGFQGRRGEERKAASRAEDIGARREIPGGQFGEVSAVGGMV